MECLDVLVSLYVAQVDTLDSNGCTPLFYAVTLGHADCTELLLKHGAHPDRQDRKGRTYVAIILIFFFKLVKLIN